MNEEKAAEEGNTAESETNGVPFGIRAIERTEELEGGPAADVQQPAAAHTR